MITCFPYYFMISLLVHIFSVSPYFNTWLNSFHVGPCITHGYMFFMLDNALIYGDMSVVRLSALTHSWMFSMLIYALTYVHIFHISPCSYSRLLFFHIDLYITHSYMLYYTSVPALTSGYVFHVGPCSHSRLLCWSVLRSWWHVFIVGPFFPFTCLCCISYRFLADRVDLSRTQHLLPSCSVTVMATSDQWVAGEYWVTGSVSVLPTHHLEDKDLLTSLGMILILFHFNTLV